MSRSADLAFQVVARHKGLLPAARLGEALREAEARGLALEAYLCDTGELDPAAAAGVVRALARHARTCPACGHQQFLLPGQRAEALACEACGAALAVAARSPAGPRPDEPAAPSPSPAAPPPPVPTHAEPPPLAARSPAEPSPAARPTRRTIPASPARPAAARASVRGAPPDRAAEARATAPAEEPEYDDFELLPSHLQPAPKRAPAPSPELDSAAPVAARAPRPAPVRSSPGLGVNPAAVVAVVFTVLLLGVGVWVFRPRAPKNDGRSSAGGGGGGGGGGGRSGGAPTTDPATGWPRFTGDYTTAVQLSSDEPYWTFVIDVPEATDEVELTVRGASVDVDLYACFGRDMRQWTEADHWANGTHPDETLVLSRQGSPPLRTGTYYVDVALARHSTTSVTFSARSYRRRR